MMRNTGSTNNLSTSTLQVYYSTGKYQPRMHAIDLRPEQIASIALKMDDSRDTVFGSVCLRVAVLAGVITWLGVAYIIARSRRVTRNH